VVGTLPPSEGKTPREVCRPHCRDVNKFIAALERELLALSGEGPAEYRGDNQPSPPVPAGGVWDLEDELSAEHARALRARLMLLTHLVPWQYHDVRDRGGRFAPVASQGN
jgi:hypothetical protein